MKRDLYWDSLKFVLIFLVVLGHSVGSYLPSGGIDRPLYNFIYTFHMPLFIFVSGMFSHINDREKYKSGILRILETYAVFQLFRAVPPILINGNITLNSITSVVISPRYTLWYLLSLILWRLIVYYLPDNVLNKYPIGIIIVCFFVSLLGGFVPIGHTFSLQRTMAFLPFFFMGYYAKDIEVKKHIAKIPAFVAVWVLLSVFLIYYFVLNKSYSFVLYANVPYGSKNEYSLLFLFFARGIFLVFATLMGAMVMRLVPSNPSLSCWGSNTLFIYIYHSFIITALRFAIGHGFFPKNEWILIVLPVFIMMGLILLSHIKLFKIFLNPISYCLKHKNSFIF